MNIESQQLFQKELLKDEKILWSGQPDTSIIFTKMDAFLVPFSIMWGGFAVFWELSVIVSGAPFFFMLWGIPFVLVGLYFIFGRFIYKKKKKENTHYAVTNKRVLILSKNDFQESYIDTIPAFNKTIKHDGIGTIKFGNSNIFSSMYANTGLDFFGLFYGKDVPTFYDIKEAQRVYDMVINMRNS